MTTTQTTDALLKIINDGLEMAERPHEERGLHDQARIQVLLPRALEALKKYIEWAALVEAELGHIEKTHRCNDHHCEVCHALQSIPLIPIESALAILNPEDEKP